MFNIANHELLAAALVGYQRQLEDITAKIAEIKAKLGKASSGRAPGAPAAGGGRRKRRVSAEGRARMAAAQRARWAKFRKTAKAAA
jgi:hypothetical protein